jgi:hypothetical protein
LPTAVAPAGADEEDLAPGADASEAAGVPRFARIPSTHVVLQRGRVVLLAGDGGGRMWTPSGLSPEVARAAVAAYLARPSMLRRVTLRLWNGEPALGGPAQELLRPLGFSRTPAGLEWYKPM